jgi:hypothetical protein
MNHHAPQGTHPETVELDHVHLCSYTPDEPKHETMVETGGVKHQGWGQIRWREIYRRTATPSGIGKDGFGTDEWSGAHDAISADYR